MLWNISAIIQQLVKVKRLKTRGKHEAGNILRLEKAGVVEGFRSNLEVLGVV